MVIGKIKFYNKIKGFGFISPEDGSSDVYVPSSSLVASGLQNLSEGQRVSFDVRVDTRGSKAIDLKII